MSRNSELLSMMDDLRTLQIRKTDITFDEAASSLNTKNPIVQARPIGVKWMMTTTLKDETPTPTILSHVGIWAWESDLQTGNFVPEGETAPPGVPEARIQTIPSFRCEINYAFDTSVDDSFWRNLHAMEEHVLAQPNFNKAQRQRRQWQNGRDPTLKNKFIVSSKIFVRSPYPTNDDYERNLEYEPHTWIKDAIETYPELHMAPNPSRAQYWADDDGHARKLEDTNDPIFHKNDIILMTFRMRFIVGSDSWSPEIVPIELVRIGKLPDHLITNSDLATLPPLGPKFSPIESGMKMDIFSASTNIMKRKSCDDSESDDSYSNKKQMLKVAEDSEYMEDTTDNILEGPPKSRVRAGGKAKLRNSDVINV